jgi:hypothetical protein
MYQPILPSDFYPNFLYFISKHYPVFSIKKKYTAVQIDITLILTLQSTILVYA